MDALGRRQRTYHERTRDADAHAVLGDRGTTYGELYAYAWNRKRDAFDVVKLYAYASNRVTRHLVSENPDGGRRLGRAHVNAHHSRRQREQGTRTSNLWAIGGGILASVARDARKRAYVANGIGV